MEVYPWYFCHWIHLDLLYFDGVTMNFPKQETLRENSHAFNMRQQKQRMEQFAAERIKKISEKMLKASQSGKNYINVRSHWMTDEMRRELKESGMVVQDMVRVSDRIDGEDYYSDNTRYIRVSW